MIAERRIIAKKMAKKMYNQNWGSIFSGIVALSNLVTAVFSVCFSSFKTMKLVL